MLIGLQLCEEVWVTGQERRLPPNRDGTPDKLRAETQEQETADRRYHHLSASPKSLGPLKPAKIASVSRLLGVPSRAWDGEDDRDFLAGSFLTERFFVRILPSTHGENETDFSQADAASGGPE